MLVWSYVMGTCEGMTRQIQSLQDESNLRRTKHGCNLKSKMPKRGGNLCSSALGKLGVPYE